MGCVSTKDAKKYNLNALEKRDQNKMKLTKKDEVPKIEKKKSLVIFSDDVLWAEVEKAFQMHDKNMDEKLSAEEANGFIVQWCQDEFGIKEPRKSLVQRTFDEIDRNKDQ